MAISVKGKSAIVTGAGSGTYLLYNRKLESLHVAYTWSAGINLSFARLLLENGCNVLIADLALRPEAQAVVDKYSAESSSSPRAVFQKTDVRDWLQLERMFKVAEEEFGEVDIVCPGAGVYEPVSFLALDRLFCFSANVSDNNSV